MFCFNEAPNQAEIPQVLWILVAVRCGVQPISPGCLCGFTWFVFSVPPHLHRGRGNHKPTRGCTSLCAGPGSPQVVSPENSFPPLPPRLTSPASLCTISQHNFCSLRGKFRERGTKSQQLSGGMSSAFQWSEHCLIYEALLCLSCSQRERIYLQKENNNQPRVLLSVPHR